MAVSINAIRRWSNRNYGKAAKPQPTCCSPLTVQGPRAFYIPYQANVKNDTVLLLMQWVATDIVRNQDKCRL